MPSFLDEFARTGPVQADAIALCLEVGGAPSLLTKEAEADEGIGLEPLDVVAALARVGLGPDDSLGPPLTQAAPARPKLAPVVAREATLMALFPTASRPDRLALAAGLLQILDAWDASHHAAQEADDLGEGATAAAWHLIAHRREPDLGNARYWVRRARPDAFRALAPLVRPLLDAPGVDPVWPTRLLGGRGGGWDPAAWVDLAGRVHPGSPEETLARRLQRLEMLALLSESVARVG